MSKHSHWATIKRKKEVSDKKRGQIFSKILRMIRVAAKEGTNPETNPKLRLAIEKAKDFSVPKETIERAIKGTEAQAMEEFLYEAYGPGKVAILIEGITDNKNRALTEIKKILERNQGKLVSPGSIKWLFERKGYIAINLKSQIPDFQKKEELEMLAIEAGAEDLRWSDDVLEIYTKPENLENVKKNLESRGIKVEDASLDWVAKEEIKVSEEEKIAIQKLFEDLDESEEVQEIYSNLRI
jgi:YebC/PmpR family DNA-binding regulatory protein